MAFITYLLKQVHTLPNSNLSIQEKEDLKELVNRDNLVISKAEKGGATIIQDIVSYIQEETRQLENTNFFPKLNNKFYLTLYTKINTLRDKI